MSNQEFIAPSYEITERKNNFKPNFQKEEDQKE